MDSYKKIKSEQEANDMVKGMELDEGIVDGPVRLLVEPGDITDYYLEKMNFIRKDLSKLNRLIFLSDSTQPITQFGYNYFSYRDTIQFIDNANMPSNYILGYGDEIIISVWGQAEQHVRKTLDRDGTIFVENVGLLYLGGKTLSQAKTYALNRFSKVYATLNSKPQLTFLELSIGKIKNINISVAGHVQFPGNYVVNPSISVSNILILSGGINETGTLRNIFIQRNGSLVDTLDLYPLITGLGFIKESQIIDGDIIVVPPRGETIAVTGEVINPAYFEIKSNENIDNILKYSGLVNIRSDIGIILARSQSKNLYVPKSDYQKITLLHGDSLIVPISYSMTELISVSVSNRSIVEIPWVKDLSFSQIIKILQVKKNNIQSVELIRRNINNKQEIVPFDPINSINFKFVPSDHLSIHLSEVFIPTKSVIVKGEVNSPGTYPLIENKESLRSVLERAGGLQITSDMNSVLIKRDTLTFGSNTGDLILTPGDTIIANPHIGTVKVEGEVHYPGNFEWRKDILAKNYISLAGGLTAYADKKHIIYITPYGEAKKIKSNSRISILPGGTIRISEMPITKQNILPDRFQQISSLVTSVVSIAILANTTAK
tara:strand:- start:181 stop:1989 length:1809 start_codon:yes stop_codon:yes gene_type:complete